jgi:hypothetical protein
MAQKSLAEMISEAQWALMDLRRPWYLLAEVEAELSKRIRGKPYRIHHDVVFESLISTSRMLLIDLASFSVDMLKKGGVLGQVKARSHELPCKRCGRRRNPPPAGGIIASPVGFAVAGQTGYTSCRAGWPKRDEGPDWPPDPRAFRGDAVRQEKVFHIPRPASSSACAPGTWRRYESSSAAPAERRFICAGGAIAGSATAVQAAGGGADVSSVVGRSAAIWRV